MHVRLLFTIFIYFYFTHKHRIVFFKIRKRNKNFMFSFTENGGMSYPTALGRNEWAPVKDNSQTILCCE